MSRRQRAVRREIPADPRFGSVTVAKFINALMYDGKKSLAERIFYDALDFVEERAGQTALYVFKQALNNTTPVLEAKSRRVGATTNRVPVDGQHGRRTGLA